MEHPLAMDPEAMRRAGYARDWGGGFGYARLATVRCTDPGRLVRLTSEDLRWLTETEPAVKARLALAEADRLRNR